jgi:hypothetical protein
MFFFLFFGTKILKIGLNFKEIKYLNLPINALLLLVCSENKPSLDYEKRSVRQ